MTRDFKARVEGWHLEDTMANTYLLLYTGGKMPESAAEQKEVMGAWTSWFGKHGDAITDAGNPFTPQAKTIDAHGKVTDAPFAPASGYTLIKADSLDNAVEIAKGCPVLLGGAKLSVYETFDAMAAMSGGAS
jgi:hypothetical protein